MSFLNLEACTNLMRGDTKKYAQTLILPDRSTTTLYTVC